MDLMRPYLQHLPQKGQTFSLHDNVKTGYYRLYKLSSRQFPAASVNISYTGEISDIKPLWNSPGCLPSGVLTTKLFYD